MGGKEDDVALTTNFTRMTGEKRQGNLKEILKGKLQLERSVIGN
jgi:hypothetical protein